MLSSLTLRSTFATNDPCRTFLDPCFLLVDSEKKRVCSSAVRWPLQCILKNSTFEHVISCAKSREFALSYEINVLNNFLTDSYHFSHKRSNVPNFRLHLFIILCASNVSCFCRFNLLPFYFIFDYFKSFLSRHK